MGSIPVMSLANSANSPQLRMCAEMSKYAIRNGTKIATNIPAASFKRSGNREWKEGILNKAHKAVDEIFTSALKEVFNQVMEGAESLRDMGNGEWHTLADGIGKTEVRWDDEEVAWIVQRTAGSGKDEIYSEMIKELWRDLSDELTHKGHNEEYSPTVTQYMMEGGQ